MTGSGQRRVRYAQLAPVQLLRALQAIKKRWVFGGGQASTHAYIASENQKILPIFYFKPAAGTSSARLPLVAESPTYKLSGKSQKMCHSSCEFVLCPTETYFSDRARGTNTTTGWTLGCVVAFHIPIGKFIKMTKSLCLRVQSILAVSIEIAQEISVICLSVQTLGKPI